MVMVVATAGLNLKLNVAVLSSPLNLTATFLPFTVTRFTLSTPWTFTVMLFEAGNSAGFDAFIVRVLTPAEVVDLMLIRLKREGSAVSVGVVRSSS